MDIVEHRPHPICQRPAPPRPSTSNEDAGAATRPPSSCEMPPELPHVDRRTQRALRSTSGWDSNGPWSVTRCPQVVQVQRAVGRWNHDGSSAGSGRPSISRRYACSSRGSPSSVASIPSASATSSHERPAPRACSAYARICAIATLRASSAARTPASGSSSVRLGRALEALDRHLDDLGAVDVARHALDRLCSSHAARSLRRHLEPAHDATRPVLDAAAACHR